MCLCYTHALRPLNVTDNKLDGFVSIYHEPIPRQHKVAHISVNTTNPFPNSW